ncbi:MAG: hypothetical protein OQL19_13980, partial [Gammaproteobacteria bacterium]|nr:hypothetical protein [Gammaproteobacteria bacterium]
DAELDFGDQDKTDEAQTEDEQDNTENQDDQELQITLSIDSEQSENDTPQERIDIDAELSALKETYQQIDAIDKKSEEQVLQDAVESSEHQTADVEQSNTHDTNSDESSDISLEKTVSSDQIDISAELNALRETHQQNDAIDDDDIKAPDSDTTPDQ